MSHQRKIISFILLLSINFALGEKSAYEQLIDHGLPPGLLPPTVESYVLQDDGHFVVHLKGQCYSTVNHGLIHVRFSPTLTGVIQEGKLAELKGINVKPPQASFLWVEVNTIYVENLYPSPGIIHFVVAFGIEEILDVEEFTVERACSKKSMFPGYGAGHLLPQSKTSVSGYCSLK